MADARGILGGKFTESADAGCGRGRPGGTFRGMCTRSEVDENADGETSRWAGELGGQKGPANQTAKIRTRPRSVVAVSKEKATVCVGLGVGLFGSVNSGLRDLSYNKKYFKGFGE